MIKDVKEMYTCPAQGSCLVARTLSLLVEVFFAAFISMYELCDFQVVPGQPADREPGNASPRSGRGQESHHPAPAVLGLLSG